MNNDKTIHEIIKEYFKTNSVSGYDIKNRMKEVKRDFSSFNEVYTHYQLSSEYQVEYSLFKLYCFFDYSFEDIYSLLQESCKYSKSNLVDFSFSDFLEYTEVRHYKERKDYYLKSKSEDYQELLSMKEKVESENIKKLTDDYNDTIEIIDCLNQDIKDICNDEDISPEKRICSIDKYSKISMRLNEKRFSLLDKIQKVRL